MDDIKYLIYISGLIAKKKYGSLSSGEEKKLKKWYNNNKDNKKLINKLHDETYLAKEIKKLEKYNSKRAYKKVKEKLGKNKINRMININILKYAAAIILLIGLSCLLYLYSSKNEKELISVTEINPGKQKAILITSDNQIIELGKSQKKIIPLIKANAVDTNSTLTYRNIGSTNEIEVETKFNELKVPRGGEYSLVLTDGSQIMLNSDSRLKFPVVFNSHVREVFLEGEALFNVSKSETPFIVKTKDMNVIVYGTQFNVSAYVDENNIHTTLVEGSVGVTFDNTENTTEYKLTPGLQVNLNLIYEKIEVKPVDVQLFIAWTQGKFAFENEPLDKILRKLARWYDCEIEFEDEKLKAESFTGELKRYDEILNILDMISIASNIGFKIHKKKIIVYQEK